MSDKEKLPWGLKPDQIAPGSMKSLSKDKLEAFDQGTLNLFVKKHLSKKEQEELRKKQEDEAAKEVLTDFVASFENTGKSMTKMFIKGAVINPSTKEEKTAVPDKGVLYKPALKLLQKTSNSVQSSPVSSTSSTNILNTSLGDKEHKEYLQKKKQNDDKKKSNLELFKEELKRIQMERDERQKKQKPDSLSSSIQLESKSSRLEVDHYDSEESNTSTSATGTTTTLTNTTLTTTSSSSNGKPNSCDDPNTTNIFISNLSPKTKEQDLMQRFGKYGPLASVKIMWPRTDEEKARNANCGFVAFMSRKDAEMALKELDGCLENNQTMRLSWSKSITIPIQPVYIPPELMDVILPPPPSGLPFNAQPLDSSKIRHIKKKYSKKRKLKLKTQSQDSSKSSTSSSSSSSSSSSTSSSSSSSSSSRSSSSRSSRSSSSSPSRSKSNKKDNLNKTLQNALVKVVIPTDKTLLGLIHRTIEFVIREGPAFEALLMSKEINNPQFRFLFDNQSPSHSYYRWKLFSIAHGESVSEWSTHPFKMFKNGSYWQPPPVNRYTQGMPDESFEKARLEFESRKGCLSTEKRSKLEDLLANINTERKSIGETMIFCIDNAEKSEEIIKIIIDSLSISDTPLSKKIARLYLISDILHNCCVPVAHASNYRRGFEKYLLEVFEHISQVWQSIEGKMKSESFKQKVIGVVRAWEDWAIYPNDYLVKLQNMFLGLLNNANTNTNNSNNNDKNQNNINIDKKETQEPHDTDDDVDGKPLDENEDYESKQDDQTKSKFVSSKWETVDPDKLEKQAITTSKWDFFDENNDRNSDTSKNGNADANASNDEDIDGVAFDENDKISNDDDDDDADIDGKPMDDADFENEFSNNHNSSKPNENVYDEEKRKFLREIEVKIMKYIDDLESGKIERKKELTIQQQAEEYRNELINNPSLVSFNSTDKNDHSNSVNNNNNSANNRGGNKQARSRSISTSSSSSSDSSTNRNKKKRRSESPRNNRSSSSYHRYDSYKSAAAASSSSSSSSSNRRKHR